MRLMIFSTLSRLSYITPFTLLTFSKYILNYSTSSVLENKKILFNFNLSICQKIIILYLSSQLIYINKIFDLVTCAWKYDIKVIYIHSSSFISKFLNKILFRNSFNYRQQKAPIHIIKYMKFWIKLNLKISQ